MGLTGKYDFKGIKKWGALGIESALSTVPWAAAIFKIPVIGTIARGTLELLVNWFANEGLLIINIGAIAIEGQWDQKGFDDAMNEALKKVQDTKGQLTDAQKKAIDDEVIKNFRKFGVITRDN